MQPAAIKEIEASPSELLSPQINSSLVGYKKNGRHQKMMNVYTAMSANKSIIYGDKYLPKSTVKNNKNKSNNSQDAQSALQNCNKLSVNELMRIFPYFGHRTQSALSVLVSRYSAPIFDGKNFRFSSDLSSHQAKSNWEKVKSDSAP